MWPQIARLALAVGSLAALIMWALWRSDPLRRRATAGVGLWLKVSLLVACSVALTGWLGLVASVNGHLHQTEPDPETGRVYRWNNHGIIYLTKEEKLTAQFFEDTFVLGWAVGFGIVCVAVLRQRRTDAKTYTRPRR